MYGSGLTRALGWRQPRIYHGIWGSAPFQSLYEPAPSLLGFLPQMPEWHLITTGLAGMAVLSAVFEPLKLAVPMLIVALLPPVAQAWLSAARASFPEASRRRARLMRRGLTAALHLLPPPAPPRGRPKNRLPPPRPPRAPPPAPPWAVTAAIWGERREAQHARLR